MQSIMVGLRQEAARKEGAWWKTYACRQSSVPTVRTQRWSSAGRLTFLRRPYSSRPWSISSPTASVICFSICEESPSWIAPASARSWVRRSAYALMEAH